MGSTENVELVRAAMGHDHAASAAAWAAASEDLVWHFEAEGSELAGDYRGKDSVFTNFQRRLFELTDNTFTVKPVDISPAGDQLVTCHYWTSMSIDGKPRSGDGVLVFQMVDGAIAEVFDIPDRELFGP